MAGPVPTYVITQTGAQTAFTVPFGLLAFVNAAIAAAVAAGEFNVTVDCSLFVTEDVSNLRIYLDSLGYRVDFAKDTNNKSLNIDWGRFLTETQVSGTVTANQGTTPWVISGTVTTSPDVNVHDGIGNAITSTGGALDVNISSFPGTVTVDQGTSPWVVSGTVAATQSGVWSTGRTWTLSSGTDSVNIGNFPATVAVTQGTTPWTVDGTIIANQGTSPWNIDGTVAATQAGTWTVQQGTPPWSVSVTNFPAVQPVSGTVTALQGTSPWVVSGTVTADAGAGTFTTREAPATGRTVTRVASAISAHTLAAANASRVGLLLYNDSTGIQYVKYGSSASATDFTVRLTSQDYWEMPYPIDQGIITALSGNTNGGVQVTEQTA